MNYADYLLPPEPPEPKKLVDTPGPLRVGITVEFAYGIGQHYALPYKEPLANLKALAKELKAAKREKCGYMSDDELCSDVMCDLCYKHTYDRALWNQ